MVKKNIAAKVEKRKGKLGKKIKKSTTSHLTLKTKVVIVPNQSITGDKSAQPTTTRKLTYDELMTHLRHYSPSVKQDGIAGLEELLGTHSYIILQNATKTLAFVATLLMDEEEAVRKAATVLIGHVLMALAQDDSVDIRDYTLMLVMHLCRSLSHVDDNIKLASILGLDAWLYNLNDHPKHRVQMCMSLTPSLFKCLIDCISASTMGIRSLSVAPSSLFSKMKNRAIILNLAHQILECSGCDHLLTESGCSLTTLMPVLSSTWLECNPIDAKGVNSVWCMHGCAALLYSCARINCDQISANYDEIHKRFLLHFPFSFNTSLIAEASVVGDYGGQSLSLTAVYGRINSWIARLFGFIVKNVPCACVDESSKKAAPTAVRATSLMFRPPVRQEDDDDDDNRMKVDSSLLSISTSCIISILEWIRDVLIKGSSGGISADKLCRQHAIVSLGNMLSSMIEKRLINADQMLTETASTFISFTKQWTDSVGYSFEVGTIFCDLLTPRLFPGDSDNIVDSASLVSYVIALNRYIYHAMKLEGEIVRKCSIVLLNLLRCRPIDNQDIKMISMSFVPLMHTKSTSSEPMDVCTVPDVVYVGQPFGAGAKPVVQGNDLGAMLLNMPIDIQLTICGCLHCIKTSNEPSVKLNTVIQSLLTSSANKMHPAVVQSLTSFLA